MQFNDDVVHKGFYENNEEEIKFQLFKVKSKSISIELKNGEHIYYDASIFLHGLCHIFAYVLHQKFGYDIYEIKNESGTMKHWCCISTYNDKEIYIDVRGITTDYNEVLSDFQPNIGLNPSMKKILNLSDYDDEWEEDIVMFANEIIDKYYSYYSLKEM